MEYHVKLSHPVADICVIEDAIQAFDPAAQVDIDKPNQTLRVAGYLEATELVSLLNRNGCPVDPQQVVQLPSMCCGGCGG